MVSRLEKDLHMWFVFHIELLVYPIGISRKDQWNIVQWEFQDPKMEVLCHIRPYFAGIFPYVGLI